MSKGVGVTTLLIVVLFFIFLLMLAGFSMNWDSAVKANTSPLGVNVLGAVFSDIAFTFGNSFTLINTVMWLGIFFGVQGIFIFVYVKLGQLILVHVPDIQKAINNAKRWLS